VATGNATGFKFSGYIYRANPNKSPLIGAWAYPGTAQFFGVPPIISGTGKAMDFKFGGYFYRANKSPLKIWEKRERGCIQGLPKFFGYPLLSQERVKLRTSNFVGTFIESIRTKGHKMLRIVAVGVVRESRKFSGHPCNGMYRAHCAVIFAIAQLSCAVM